MSWIRTLDAQMPAAALPSLIDQSVARSLNDLAWQLQSDRELTPADRARALALAAPIIRARTEETIYDGWLRLQPRQ